jgi:hypothetical protein
MPGIRKPTVIGGVVYPGERPVLDGRIDGDAGEKVN